MSEEQQKWERRIDLGDGSGIQVFTGDSQEELVDKLVAAQENATRKIREQQRQIKTGLGLITPDPDEPIPDYKPRHLSADEQFRLSQELLDPVKAPDAIAALLEAKTGVPIDRYREIAREIEVNKRVQRAYDESAQFLKEHPDYYPCDENKDLIVAYLEKNKMAMTKKNMELAYQDLRDSGLLAAKPVDKEPPRTQPEEPELKQRIVAPRTSSLRPGGNTPPVVKPKITWDEINKMNPAVYAERLRDPEFRRMVDSLPAR